MVAWNALTHHLFDLWHHQVFRYSKMSKTLPVLIPKVCPSLVLLTHIFSIYPTSFQLFHSTRAIAWRIFLIAALKMMVNMVCALEIVVCKINLHFPYSCLGFSTWRWYISSKQTDYYWSIRTIPYFTNLPFS